MKQVILIIEVPTSGYCFDGQECCCYFDNYGGHGICALNLGSIEFKRGLYIKPEECLRLKRSDK